MVLDWNFFGHLLAGETTSTTASPLPPVLLHKEEEYEYYKVVNDVLLVMLYGQWSAVHLPLLWVWNISYYL